ncbi:hypothetical protein pb186bvf_012997 [Paramecium bursaria]
MIQTLVKENDVLQAKLQELQHQEADEQKKLQQTQERYDGQTKRMKELQQKQIQFDQEREELFQHGVLHQLKISNQNLYNQFIQYFQQQTTHSSIQTLPTFNTLNTISSQTLIQFDHQDEFERIVPTQPKPLQELSQQTNTLVEQKNKVLLQTLESIYNYSQIQLQKSQKKECQQCHQQYNPRTNNIDSCLFHNGKMKFYSCKKCGADDYFTCCNKCIRCSEGCKTNFHQPKP